MKASVHRTVLMIVITASVVVGINWLINVKAAETGTPEVQKAIAEAKALGYSGRSDGGWNNVHAETLILSTGITVSYFENQGDRCYVSNTGAISCVGRGRY